MLFGTVPSRSAPSTAAAASGHVIPSEFVASHRKSDLAPRPVRAPRNNLRMIRPASSETPSGVDIQPPSSGASPSHDSAAVPAPKADPSAAASSAEDTPPVAAASATSVDEASAASQGVNWQTLSAAAWHKLRRNLWPLVLVHLLCDAAIFGLHRLSHRLTNEVAVAVLAGGMLSPEAIGNMWWLSSDPGIANFQTGYQPLTLAIFLAAFPLNILIKTLAAIATVRICASDAGAEAASIPWWRPLAGLKAALPTLLTLWPAVSSVWKPVFVVEFLVTLAVMPLQAASLAVVTLPLTLPLIVSLQAAIAAAVLEGQRGMAAIQRSRTLLHPMRWALAVPFVGLVVVARLLEAGKGAVLSAVPPRFYKELLEIPVTLVVGGAVAGMVLARLQDVLPFVAYQAATQQEGSEGGDTGGGGVDAVAIASGAR